MTDVFVVRLGKRIRKHTWTVEDEAYLRREYDCDGQSADRIASHIGVTANAVRTRAKKLGIARRHYFYTDEELDYIRENYNRMTTAKIARKLGRGVSSIRQMAYNMQIQKRDRDGWFTKQEVGEILGVDNSWIDRRIKGGCELEMKRFNSEDAPRHVGYNPWYITEKALRKFIRTYTNELIGRKIDVVMVVDILAGITPVDERVRS